MQRVMLIGCSASKLDRAAPARELYTGDLFKKAAALAEKRGARWLVLSARHGVVWPGQVLEPYDDTLIGTPSSHRTCWGNLVRHQLNTMGLLRQPLEILAGRAYRGAWTAGLDVAVPLAGLGIGQQKARLAEMLRGGAA